MNKKTLVADYVDLAKERDDLKAENDLLKKQMQGIGKLEDEILRLQTKLLDKTSREEVLRKAIEESLFSIENRIPLYYGVYGTLKKALEEPLPDGKRSRNDEPRKEGE